VPEAAAVGETVTVVFLVTNTGDTELTDVELDLDFDMPWAPFKASPGHKAKTARHLVWTYGKLEAGGALSVEAECTCEAAADKACALVTVTTANGVAQTHSACLRIDQPTSDLSLAVAGLKNPVTAGREVNYEVRVTNHGQAVDKDLVVSADVPEGMSAILQLGTRGPDSLLRARLSGSKLTFDRVPEIGIGETLTWRIRLRADEPGDVTLRVTLDSAGLPAPLSADEQTTVLARN
jgi:hypothetical protein